MYDKNVLRSFRWLAEWWPSWPLWPSCPSSIILWFIDHHWPAWPSWSRSKIMIVLKRGRSSPRSVWWSDHPFIIGIIGKRRIIMMIISISDHHLPSESSLVRKHWSWWGRQSMIVLEGEGDAAPGRRQVVKDRQQQQGSFYQWRNIFFT